MPHSFPAANFFPNGSRPNGVFNRNAPANVPKCLLKPTVISIVLPHVCQQEQAADAPKWHRIPPLPAAISDKAKLASDVEK